VKWVGGAYYWNQLNQTRGTRYSMEEFVSGLYTHQHGVREPDLHVRAASAAAAPGTAAAERLPRRLCSECQSRSRFDSITRYDQHGYALFGEATISLTKKIDMTLGMRYPRPARRVDTESIVPGVTAPRAPYANDRFVGNVFEGSSAGFEPTPSHFSKNTYRFSVQDQFSPDVMAYIGYSEGFQLRGRLGVPRSLDGRARRRSLRSAVPENTEIGVRSDLANKHLR
jgi:outer membrane receptor protein involved in Fe transport